MLFILQKGMQKLRERMCVRQTERKKEEGEEEEERKMVARQEWVSTYYDYHTFLLGSL